MKQDIHERWEKPAIRLGIWSTLAGIVLMFLPGIYLALRYDTWLGFGAFGKAFLICLIYFGINWFLEPVLYFPPLGMVGTYMSWLSGSITSAKIPAAVVARSELGVADDSQEAEVVTVYALYGATLSNAAVLTLIAVLGSVLLRILPEVVRQALATYVMPSLFGTLLAMFGCEMPLLTFPVFGVMILIHILVAAGFVPIPAPIFTAILPIFAVVGTVWYARFLYKKGKIFASGGKGKPQAG